MTPIFPDLLQCPVTGGDLHLTDDSHIAAVGGPAYPMIDGVTCFLPETLRVQGREGDASQSIRDFYQNDGWEVGEDGLYGDSRAFLDSRPIARKFEDHCIDRIGRHFAKGGKYILDAGSGPIPHKQLLPYSDAFEKRICVDLSVQGLRAARQKLGDRGVYLQADISRLPIRDNSVDAITCNHVLYQIPEQMQKDAFLELWRVLKPGGIAVIVYWWPTPSLPHRLGRVAKLMRALTGMRGVPQNPDAAWPELYHHPHSPDWLEAQRFPFAYKLDAMRVINDAFIRDNLSDDWRGHSFIAGVKALQRFAPGFCGRTGQMPAIIIRKE